MKNQLAKLSIVALTVMSFASTAGAAPLFVNQYITGGNAAGLEYEGIEVAGGAINSNGVRHFNDLRAAPWNLSFNQNTEGTYYVGFLIKISSSSGHYNAFELNGSANDSDRALTFGRLKDAFFSLRTTEGTTPLVAVAGSANTGTNLVVLELIFSAAAGGDSVKAYLNPGNLAGPAGNTVSASLSGFDFKNINYANIAGYSGGNTTVDEIRFGHTWSDVVAAIPERMSVILIR